MSEDLRTDNVKLESPSILTKKFFLPGHWGLGPLVPPCLRQWVLRCRRNVRHDDYDVRISNAAGSAFHALALLSSGQVQSISYECILKSGKYS